MKRAGVFRAGTEAGPYGQNSIEPGKVTGRGLLGEGVQERAHAAPDVLARLMQRRYSELVFVREFETCFMQAR